MPIPIRNERNTVSVDLADLVPNIKLEVNPPGTNLFPEATDTEWAERLANAFWNARIDGMLPGYIESDGFISPITGTTDMPRELQQVIVFMAAYNTIYLKLLTQRTGFRAQAGSVEYETSSSATVLKGLADSLKERYNILLGRLSDLGLVPTYVIDSYLARDNALGAGVGVWVGTGRAPHTGGYAR